MNYKVSSQMLFKEVSSVVNFFNYHYFYTRAQELKLYIYISVNYFSYHPSLFFDRSRQTILIVILFAINFQQQIINFVTIKFNLVFELKRTYIRYIHVYLKYLKSHTMQQKRHSYYSILIIIINQSNFIIVDNVNLFIATLINLIWLLILLILFDH